jgi:signal transduction histidine kinase
MEEDHPNNPAGVPIEITVKIIRDNAGNPFSIFVNIRDLTNARKEIEEKKRLEEQLRQAQKMESIGTLAGGIAHDFNNILAAIIGYTEIANIETPKDSPVKKDLSEVLKAAHRAKELVKQILTFSRKADYTVEPVLPVPIIKEALKMLRASIPTNIEIKQDIDSECGGTLADPTQIHQILVNLCTNAYQAMEEKGGVLTVTLAKKRSNFCRHQRDFRYNPRSIYGVNSN